MTKADEAKARGGEAIKQSNQARIRDDDGQQEHQPGEQAGHNEANVQELMAHDGYRDRDGDEWNGEEHLDGRTGD